MGRVKEFYTNEYGDWLPEAEEILRRSDDNAQPEPNGAEPELVPIEEVQSFYPPAEQAEDSEPSGPQDYTDDCWTALLKEQTVVSNPSQVPSIEPSREDSTTKGRGLVTEELM